MKIFSPVLKGTTISSGGTTNLSGSFTGSLQGTAATASYVVSSQTDTAQNTRLSTIESRTGSFATTASNSFSGSQTITGSLTATGTIVAQTLVVQTVTSSVVYSSGSNIFGLNSGNNHQFTGSVLVSGSTTTTSWIKTSNNIFTGGNDTGIFLTGITNDYSWGMNRETAGLTFYASSSSTPKLTITSGSNVGIGTTSPQWMLELTKDTNSGAFGQYPAISVNNPNAGGYSAYYFFSGTTNKGGIEYSNSTNALSIFGNNAERIRINSSGSVGIGTTSPINRLDVLETTSNTYGIISARGNNRGGGLELYNGSTITAAIYSLTTNELLFYNGTYVERMRISSGGNVGIGVTTPGFKLDVDSGTAGSVINLNTSRSGGGGFAISNNGSPRLYIGNANWMGISGESTSSTAISLASAENSAIIFARNAATSIVETMRITSAGNVGIGLTNPTTSKLEVNGTETIYGKSTLNASGGYTNGQAGLTVESNSWAIVDANIKRQLQRSIGYVGDYEQHVILLHPIYNSSLIEFSKCTGTIHSTRGWTYAGLISDTYHVDTATGYTGVIGTLTSNYAQGRLYTCTYNGVKYIALLPQYRTSATSYMFDGYIGNNTGGETLKLISYRNSNTGTVLNSEINNSLTPYTESDNFINGLLYPRQGIRFNSGATTLNYYEEGTFTPTNLGSNMSGVTPIFGKYVRVGNQVSINVRWNVSPGGTGQRYIVFNLPFSFLNDSNTSYTGIVSNYNNGLSAYSSNVGTSVRNSSGSTTQQYIEAVFTTNADTTLLFSMTYFTF